MTFKRFIELPIGKHSFFLFGPRQTGKTTLIQSLLKDRNVFFINLLQNDHFFKYKTHLSLLREEIEYFITKHGQGIVYMDEIQKLPELLGEVHNLIEKY